MSQWQPPADLMRLLEALANEVSASTEGEVQSASSWSPYSSRIEARLTRALLTRVRGIVADVIDEGEVTTKQLRLPELDQVGELRHRPN